MTNGTDIRELTEEETNLVEGGSLIERMISLAMEKISEDSTTDLRDLVNKKPK